MFNWNAIVNKNIDNIININASDIFYVSIYLFAMRIDTKYQESIVHLFELGKHIQMIENKREENITNLFFSLGVESIDVQLHIRNYIKTCYNNSTFTKWNLLMLIKSRFAVRIIEKLLTNQNSPKLLVSLFSCLDAKHCNKLSNIV